MTQGEMNKLLKANENTIIHQRERIEVLKNAIFQFQKQVNGLMDLIKETKTEQNDFNQSVPDDDL